MKRESEYGIDDIVDDLSTGFTYGVIVFLRSVLEPYCHWRDNPPYNLCIYKASVKLRYGGFWCRTEDTRTAV